MPHCRFDVRWEDGIEVRLQHIGAMRRLSRVLAASVRLRIEAGDYAAAWEVTETALHMADALRGEPSLVSQSLRIAQTSLALQEVRRLAPLAPPDAATRASLMSVLEEMDDRAPFVTGLDGERILSGDWAFANAVNSDVVDMQGVSTSTAHRLVLTGLYLPPVRRLDRAVYLEEMSRLTRALSEAHHWSPGPGGAGNTPASSSDGHCVAAS